MNSAQQIKQAFDAIMAAQAMPAGRDQLNATHAAQSLAKGLMAQVDGYGFAAGCATLAEAEAGLDCEFDSSPELEGARAYFLLNR